MGFYVKFKILQFADGGLNSPWPWSGMICCIYTLIQNHDITAKTLRSGRKCLWHTGGIIEKNTVSFNGMNQRTEGPRQKFVLSMVDPAYDFWNKIKDNVSQAV